VGQAIDNLLEISTDSVSSDDISPVSWAARWDTRELQSLLGDRNGFYAFESAVHVFPWAAADVMDVCTWNATETWKAIYDGAADEYLFFAENGLGDQFGLHAEGIVRFNPETTEVEHVASSIEEWAQLLLDDYRNLEHWQTAWPLVHDWQVRNGPLPVGKHLIPIIPFILQGEFSVENLMAIDCVEGMRIRAGIWRQTRDLPSGTRVEIQVNEPSV
jgi:hypothetical protein